MAVLMATQGGAGSIVSAEGDIFDIIIGRYSAKGQNPNQGLWLKAHNGDPITVDRRNSPPIFLPSPSLSMALFAQPAVLTQIGANPALKGRGLLARFVYCIPPPARGSRPNAGRTVRPEVRAPYASQLQAIAEWAAGLNETMILTPDAEAAAAIHSIEVAREPRLRDDGDLADLRDWGGKYVGTIIRIAAILHIAAALRQQRLRADTRVVGGWVLGDTALASHRISAETIQAATAIGNYLTEHAKVAFSIISGRNNGELAQRLLLVLRRSGRPRFTANDIKQMTRWKEDADLEAAGQALLHHGWLRIVGQEEIAAGRAAGRRPGQTYELRPAPAAGTRVH
jgi:hypothetical protein